MILCISGSLAWAPYIECLIWEWLWPVITWAEVSSAPREAVKIHQRKERRREERQKGRKRWYLYFPSTRVNGRSVPWCAKHGFWKGKWRPYLWQSFEKKRKGQHWRKIPHLEVQKNLLWSNDSDGLWHLSVGFVTDKQLAQKWEAKGKGDGESCGSFWEGS